MLNQFLHRLRLKLCLIILVAISICSASNVRANKVPATIRICVAAETNTSPLPKPRVTLSGGSADVVFPEADASHLCTTKDVRLDDSKQYSLRVDADGYQSPQPIALTAKDIDPNGSIERTITLKVTPVVNPSPHAGSNPSPGQSPTAEKGLLESLGEDLPEHWILDFLGVVILAVGFWVGLRLWRAGYRARIYRKVPILEGSKSSTVRILEGIDGLRGDMVKVLAEIRDELRKTNESKKETAPQVNASPPPTEPLKSPLTAPTHEEPSPSPNSGQAQAHLSYIDLLAGKKVTPTPVYLNAEGRSEPSGMFGSRITYLEESSQGAFILFKDAVNYGVGWVYPDPGQIFRRDAFASVFPNLGEAEFNNSKQSIDPVRVSLVVQGRWKVEAG